MVGLLDVKLGFEMLMASCTCLFDMAMCYSYEDIEGIYLWLASYLE